MELGAINPTLGSIYFDMILDEKQALQEAEYKTAVHWELSRAEGARYRYLSRLIASKVSGLREVQEAGAVTFLDLGCGDGAGTWQVTESLRKRGINVRVCGIEYSPRAVELAQERTQEFANPPQFIVKPVESMSELPLVGRPVVILMREVVEHLTDEQIDATFQKMAELSPGCHLLLTTPTTNSPVEPKHHRHYDRKMISDLFTRNGFEPLKVTGFCFRPRILYSFLSRLKSGLNRRAFVWRFMHPFWRQCPFGLAQTVVAWGKSHDES